MGIAKRIVASGLGVSLLALGFNSAAFSAPPLPHDAPVALLVDLASGQTLHSHEADRRFVPASVTKVMTAYVAFEMLEDGRLNLNQSFPVSDSVFEEWSGTGSTMFLPRGSTIRVDDLLRGITSVSANDAAVVLAQGAAGSVDAWLDEMNRTARALGMNDSHFGTPNGWPDEGQTFTTAHDLAKLATALTQRHPKLYKRYFGQPGFTFNGLAQANHDPISGTIKGADGIKTGYTRQAGYNFLGSASRNGRRLVMVLAGVDTGSLRKKLARDYITWGYDKFQLEPIYAKGTILGQARVQDGAKRSVPLRLAEAARVSLPEGEHREITLALTYRGPVQAPVREGERIASLEVHMDGFEPYSVPLEAAESVSSANLWQRLVNGVLGWFA